MVLSLEEIKLFLYPVAGFAHGELKRLSRLWWALKQKARSKLKKKSFVFKHANHLAADSTRASKCLRAV